jgi:ribosomal protein L33
MKGLLEGMAMLAAPANSCAAEALGSTNCLACQCFAQNKKNTPARMELMKYNKYLRRYTLHKVRSRAGGAPYHHAGRPRTQSPTFVRA